MIFNSGYRLYSIYSFVSWLILRGKFISIKILLIYFLLIMTLYGYYLPLSVLLQCYILWINSKRWWYLCRSEELNSLSISFFSGLSFSIGMICSGSLTFGTFLGVFSDFVISIFVGSLNSTSCFFHFLHHQISKVYFLLNSPFPT